MDRVAVFVDAGYFFAQGSVALSGRKASRSELALDPEKAVAALTEFGAQIAGAPLLRIYWYDGASTGPTAQHLSLAYLGNVKVRLGFVNTHGEQKGVDSLIVTDMINLARNRAMSDALLLSGDEDLRVGVQQAQEFGVRVHLLGIQPSRGSQSLFLLQEADTTTEWTADQMRAFLAMKSPAEASAATAPASKSIATDFANAAANALYVIAAEVAANVPVGDLAALVEAIRKTGQTPKELDRLLLARSRTRIGVDLDSRQKKDVRAAFVAACEKRLAIP